MEITGFDVDNYTFENTYYPEDIESGKIEALATSRIVWTWTDVKNCIFRPYLLVPKGSYYQINPTSAKAKYDYYNPGCDFDAIDLTTGTLCTLGNRGIKVYVLRGKIKVKNKIGEKDFKDILNEEVDRFPVEVENEYKVKVDRVDIRVIGYKYFDKVTGHFLYNNWNSDNDKVSGILDMDENYFGFRFDTVLFRPDSILNRSFSYAKDRDFSTRNFSTYDCFRPYTAYENSRFLNYHGAGNMSDSTGNFVRGDLGAIPVEEEVWIKV